MDGASAAAVLREFDTHRAAGSSAAKSWRWATGVLCFPDAICPFCGSAMRSNRIWLVSRYRLLGQVALMGSKLVKEPPEHPHAWNSNGAICMGGASDVPTALFLSMSMQHSHLQNKHYDWKPRWKAWNVKMFDHACDATGRAGEMSARLTVELAERREDGSGDTITLAV